MIRFVRSIAAAAALAALLGTAGCAEDEKPGAFAGTWSGVSHSHRSHTLEGFMTVGYNARGDFWFTVDNDGKVSGYAVVVYQPVTDVSGVNAKINAVKAVGSASLGILGPMGLPANISVLSMVGVEVNWSEPLPTRQGPITGTAGADQISLKWATEQPDSLKATVSLVQIDRPGEPLSEQAFPADSPWPAAGSAVGGGQQVASTGNKPSTNDNVKIATAWSWAAHRTGP